MTFRVESWTYGRIAIGVASSSTSGDDGSSSSYMFASNGRDLGGSIITVRINLLASEANTVTFLRWERSGADDVLSYTRIRPPQQIAPSEAPYHFAFDAWCEGDGVTIL